ncbi:MAG: sigma-E factor negative regulatory protein [Methylococcaceae bacterium]|nr:sigma-E factor negative regulatory protein [Methylococcaceae bacterium]
MHEDLNQKISQFLDNELDLDEALSVLHKIRTQSELKAKMSRYEAIHHVLKSDVFLYPSADFSEKVSQYIEKEPSYFLPKNQFLVAQKPINRRNKVLALAASVALVVFISAQSIHTNNKSQTATTLQLAEQKRIEQSPKLMGDPNQNDQYPINARINDYLQAHDSRVYASDEANFRPFATVSAHSRE